MRKRWIAAVVLAVGVMVPAVARAHGGHTHRIMGTVTMRQGEQLEVKTTDGKTSTIVLNARTAVLRGKQKVDLAAIKVGDRVVVDVGDGKAPVTAREVKLGVQAAAR